MLYKVICHQANFAKLTGTHMCQSFFFNKVAVVWPAKAFLELVCNKANYHPAFFALKVIRIELGVSLKMMLDFDKLLSSFE